MNNNTGPSLHNATDHLGNETTPQEISSPVLELCREIVPDQRPQFLRVSPARFAKHLACHPNVAEMVRREGGEQVFGWIIWEAPGQFLGCEFHSVWRSPAGELMDITPQADGEGTVLFLPDPARRWDGRLPLGPYRLLTDDPLIARGWRHARREKEWLTAAINARLSGATSALPSSGLSEARRLAEKTPKQRAEERRRRRKKSKVKNPPRLLPPVTSRTKGESIAPET